MPAPASGLLRTPRRDVGARAADREAADARDRQPVRDDGVRPAEEPRRPRAAEPLRGHRVRHAAPGPRDRAGPRGGRGGLRRRRRVRRRRDAERGGQRPGRDGRPAHPPPRRRPPTSSARCSAIPGEIVDATEHLLRMADEWRPRKIDLGHAAERYFVRERRLRARRRRDARRRPQARSSSTATASGTSRGRRSGRSSASTSSARRTVELETDQGLQLERDRRDRAERRPVHVLQRPAAARGRELALDSGRLAGAMLHRATPIDVPTVAYRLFSKRRRLVDHRQITGFSDVRAVRARSVDGKPSCRSSSTATGSATSARSSSASARAR